MITTDSGESFENEFHHAMNNPIPSLKDFKRDTENSRDLQDEQDQIEKQMGLPPQGEEPTIMMPGTQIPDRGGQNRDVRVSMMDKPFDPKAGRVQGEGGGNVVPMRNPANENDPKYVAKFMKEYEANIVAERKAASEALDKAMREQTKARLDRTLGRAESSVSKGGSVHPVDQKLIERHKDTFPEIYDKLKELVKDSPTRIHPERIIDRNRLLRYKSRPDDPTNVTPLKPN